MLFQRVSLYELLCCTSPPYKPNQEVPGNLEFIW
jgi:hypothetical protein